MKNFTKHLSIFLTALLILSISGCSERDPGSTRDSGSGEGAGFGESELFVSTSSQKPPQSSSSTSSQTGGLIVDPQESSEPDVKIDVEMNDQLVSLPCRLRDITGISVDLGFSFTVKQRDNGKYMTTAKFLYNDTNAGTLYLDGDCTKTTDFGGETVIGIIAEDSRVPVSYMGLTFNSSEDDIIRVLGDPVEEKDGYIYYHIEPEGSVTFSLDSEKKVSNIAVFLDIR